LRLRNDKAFKDICELCIAYGQDYIEGTLDYAGEASEAGDHR